MILILYAIAIFICLASGFAIIDLIGWLADKYIITPLLEKRLERKGKSSHGLIFLSIW